MTYRKPRPPLSEATLEELAMAYVGRFATSRAKLARYLARKLRERGWEGAGDPPIERIVERCARNGFVDDAAFGLAKARSLSSRGYGPDRLRQDLRAAGIGEEDMRPARALADDEAVEAALRFARRKRVGPFASQAMDREAREKALAAFVRGGHSYGLAKAILALEPGVEPDLESLAEAAKR